MDADPKHIPLREWMEREENVQVPDTKSAQIIQSEHNHGMIMSKVTVAYGISEIARHLIEHRGVAAAASHEITFAIDNFTVNTSMKETATSNDESNGSDPRSGEIEGVHMLSPAISLQVTEPSFLNDSSLGSVYQDQMGKYFEVEINDEQAAGASSMAMGHEHMNEIEALYSMGKLLYELLSHIDVSRVDILAGLKIYRGNENEDSRINKRVNDICEEPPRKKRVVQGFPDKDQAAKKETVQERYPPQYTPLYDFGVPSSLSSLVQNLLECGLEADDQPSDAYDSLLTLSSDLHQLLLEPSRFLFIAHESSIRKCTPASNEKMRLEFRKEKLYGRDKEISQIQESFCRVSSGQNEAFFIGGFSGAGKSRLVESLRAQVDVAGGYVVVHKFDQISKERSLLEVVWAFNDLCLIIKDKHSMQDLGIISSSLMEAFRSDVSVLVRLLPNVSLILPQLKKPAAYDYNHGDQMNVQSVGFVLQRFMRVVSSKEKPVMLFLDDLHWNNDCSALALIEGVLSDQEGSCLFFVGSYRNNEVQPGHAIYGFMDNLNSLGVPHTKLTLFGIDVNDLTTMISDAMRTFPRLCEPLAAIVFKKTEGNPLFLLEFLRSLIDRELVKYSFQGRRWTWDEEAIKSTDITDNVLFLLTDKMTRLPESSQSTLKLISCFGTKIHNSAILHLSDVHQYSAIRDGLEHVIQDGFMIKVGNYFKFVHDKVREAASLMIEEKKEYHKKLGQSLLSVCKGRELGEGILPIVDLINQGLRLTEESIVIAQLNLDAGKKCFEQSDYATANAYLKNALSLLPNDHWESEYNLALEIHYLSAKSAHSCGNGENARETVRLILKEACCIEDKVDAYFLLVNIYQAREESEKAYMTCIEVLNGLGEKLPEYCDGNDITDIVANTRSNLESKLKEGLVPMGKNESRSSSTLKCYSILSIVSFFVKPEVVPFINCRVIELTLRDGLTKYSAIGIIQFVGMICQSDLVKDIRWACKTGKFAISLLNQFDSSDTARAFFIYYGFVALYTDPIQSCDAFLKNGYEIGISNGDTFSAFFSANHHIRLSLLAGGKLPSLLKETEYYLTMVEKHENLISGRYFLIFQETIKVLIDKRHKLDGEDDSMESLCIERLSETIYFHRALQSYWIGYSERCLHYAQKLFQMGASGRHHRLIITFYYGLNAFTLLKRKSTAKLRKIPKDAITLMKDAAEHSRWNFLNKMHLLEAELSSFEGRNEEAQSSYAAAILASRSSRFIHEQGLACELAGFHFQKIGNVQRACRFFDQAKSCYTEWGSPMKVESISHQQEKLHCNNFEWTR